MDLRGLPSPPLTQNSPIESPAANLRSWLSKHGVYSDTVDDLWAKYNQRQQSYDQEYAFLIILKDVVTTSRIEFATQSDLYGIETDFELATHRRNEQLKKESDDAVSGMALDTVRLLPGDIRHDFLNFLKGDSVNARHLFLANVLPWMTRSLKRTLPDESGDESPFGEENQPQPKRRRVNNGGKRQRNSQAPQRRSARIAANGRRK